MSPVDYILCAAYLLLVLAGGVWLFRSQQTAREFFLAGGSLGWVVVGVSLMATMASSIGFLGAPAAGVRAGFTMLWSLVAIPAAYPVIVWFVIPFYRGLNIFTLYEYLERRFGLGVRLQGSGLFIARRITWMAASLYVPAKVMTVVTGGAVPEWAGVVTLGVFAAAYTTLGGIRAVIWTDLAQAAIMFGGIGTALFLLLRHVPDGLAGLPALAAAAPGAPAPETGSFAARLHTWVYSDFTVPAIVAAFTLDKLGHYGVDQMMAQRYLAARSARVARAGFTLNCVVFPLFFTLMITVGVSLRAFADATGLPPELPPDAIFPRFIAGHMPPGAAGLMLAALMAAAMSSIDSGVNACNVAVLNDFYHRLRGGYANLDAETATVPHAHPLRVARVSSLLVALAAIVLGCFVGGLGDVFRIALAFVNAFLGPLLALFILARWSRLAHARGVFWGAWVGIAATLVVVFADRLTVALAAWNGGAWWLSRAVSAVDFGFLWTSTAGFLATITPAWLLSLLLPRK
jgi:SSS family transporter